jgi:hypothetical protein
MSENEPTPLMIGPDGQPWSKKSAGAALAAFDADTDKVNAALAGDIKYQKERADLWLMSRGHQPASAAVPAPAANSAEDVLKQMRGQALHLAEAHQELLLDGGIGPEGVYQYMKVDRFRPLRRKFICAKSSG